MTKLEAREVLFTVQDYIASSLLSWDLKSDCPKS